jgi:hypothetical protein
MQEKVQALSNEPFAVVLPPSPYPGLRPFEKHEWPIFFGRESMTTHVVDRLLDNHFIVVHGDSGCGKSSLIRVGVQARLEQEQARSGREWITTDMRLGDSPLWGLAKALACGQGEQVERDFRRLLNRGRKAAPALAQTLSLTENQRLCVLVDQFEELFRFAEETDLEWARLFTDVLVGLERNPPPGLYIVLTMRSEFMGHCGRFRGLAEAINRSQYLLPRMERPALVRAIREPARVYGEELPVTLADTLIADAGGRQDQLPLIQHGLMLLWQGADPGARSGPAVQAERPGQTAGTPLGPPAPEAAPIGEPTRVKKRQFDLGDHASRVSLAELLSTHADDVMNQVAPAVDEKRRQVIEHLFRALTDINAEGQAIRRPRQFGELVAMTGADKATLEEIIDAFRAEGVSFLTPYGQDSLTSEKTIDISHEALIRCWRRIADAETGWLHREFQDGLTWQSLRVQAEGFKRNPKQVLSAAATTDLEAWIQKLSSRSWCERYGGGWDSVQDLLDASRKESEKQRREREARRRKEIRLTRFIALVSLIAFLITAALAGWAFYERRHAKEAESTVKTAAETAQRHAGRPRPRKRGRTQPQDWQNSRPPSPS